MQTIIGILLGVIFGFIVGYAYCGILSTNSRSYKTSNMTLEQEKEFEKMSKIFKEKK